LTSEYILVAAVAASIAVSLASLAYTIATLRRVAVLVSALDSRALKRYLRAAEARQRGRDRKRFIVFKLLSGKGLGKDELDKLMKKSLRELFGSATVAVAGMSLADYDPIKGVGVVRVRASHKNHAILALSAIDVMTEGEVIVQPLRTTGTLRKAMKYADSA